LPDLLIVSGIIRTSSYRAVVTGSIQRPLLFLDVDGPLIPFGAAPKQYPTYQTGPEIQGIDSNPLLARINPQHGPRLAALPCDLVWATTWMADANECIAPRIGLPQLPGVIWPEPSDVDEQDLRRRLHWKTRALVDWAAGRLFAWVDDEITDTNRAWVSAHHRGHALLHHVDPRRGLADADFIALDAWLQRTDEGTEPECADTLQPRGGREFRLHRAGRPWDSLRHDELEGQCPLRPVSPTPSASMPADAFDAWLPAALADPTGHGYGDARSAIFDAVRADRDGSIARHLLSQCEHPVPEVRQQVLQLLTDLCSDKDGWDAAADNALSLLHDPDPQVRRSAAWLLAAARFEQAHALAQDPHSDDAIAPEARLALVEAVFSWTRPITPADTLALAERLRDDSDPAVQLRAALAALRIAPEEQWPKWEALTLRCLPIAGTRLGRSGNWLRVRAGWLWSVAMVRQDRELAAYAWVARLLTHRSPVARVAGLDLARGALRQWRAAPDHLAEVFEAALDDAHTAVRAEAVQVVAACLETTRRCADRLASLVDDPELRTEAALALGRIGDQRATETVLGLVRDASISPGLSEAADSLARYCPDPGPWIAAAAAALATALDSCPTDSPARRGCALAGALNVAISLGPAAAPLVPELLDLLSEPTPLPTSCRSWARRRAVTALAAIGRAAAAAVPAVQRHASGTEFPSAAVLALAAITGDREPAEIYLDQLPTTVRTAGADVDLMEWLTDHGGLAERHAARLNAMLQRRRRIHPRALRLLWRHQGSEAADLLLETLPAYLTDDLYGPPACTLLAEMGRLAQPAVAALEAIVHRRTRIGMYIGDEDEELRADERLTEAATAALARLATPPTESG
jgi:hypothetical protein